MREIWAKRKNLLISSNLNETVKIKVQTRNKVKGKSVIVTNIENKSSIEYISISEAALALNITRLTLRKYIKNKTVFNLLKKDISGKIILKENLLITVKK
jgi:hypothetical protein